MRQSSALAALIIILATATPGLAVAEDITGLWNRGDGNARVSITRCGQAYCATNVWIRDTSTGEKVGDVLVMRVKAQSDAAYAGTAYDPQRKITLSTTVSISGSQMTTQGCVLGGMICKSMAWTRAR